jgi:phage terminase large subunit-like protein
VTDRHEAINDGLDVLASLVLEDGRLWGEAATDFQWADAAAVLDLESQTPYHFLTRSRGSSKTSDLAGIALAVLLTQFPGGARCYALASDRDQGRLLLDAIEGFITRTPMLEGAFDVGAWRVTSLANGASLDVLAADAAGAWGLRPAFVIVDEISQWQSTSAPRRLWEAVSSAVAKSPSTRLVVLTTAGDPAHWSRKVLDHALVDPLWRVNEVHGPAPWMDEQRLAEQRRRLPESSYMRLFENVWTASEDRLTNLEDLRTCVTLDGPQEPVAGRKYVVGLDVGLKHDRTVAAVCHAERNGDKTTVVLDRMFVWSGSRARAVQLSAVGDTLLLATRRYHGARVIFDPYQAADLTQRLKARGVSVTEFTFSSASVGRLGSILHLLLRNHALALPDDEALVDELANVRLRETSPGVLRIDHDPDQHDDRAIALALAAQHLVERPATPRIDARALRAMAAEFRVAKSPWDVGGATFLGKER